jgi:hypothetical protein
VALAGCSDNDGRASRDDATTTTTTDASSTTANAPSSTTSAAVSSEEADARTAYEAASRAFIDAAAIPDPDFPALATTHTGPMLEQRRKTLLGLKAEGRVIRYPTPSQYRIAIEKAVVDGDVARLSVCVVDDGERIDAKSGEVIASGVGTVRWNAAMQRIDGSWRLAERSEASRQDGVAACGGA